MTIKKTLQKFLMLYLYIFSLPKLQIYLFILWLRSSVGQSVHPSSPSIQCPYKTKCVRWFFLKSNKSNFNDNKNGCFKNFSRLSNKNTFVHPSLSVVIISYKFEAIYTTSTIASTCTCTFQTHITNDRDAFLAIEYVRFDV